MGLILNVLIDYAVYFVVQTFSDYVIVAIINARVIIGFAISFIDDAIGIKMTMIAFVTNSNGVHRL